MTQVIHGDCLHVLRGMEDNSVDAVVTDPPYGLSNTSPDKVTETIIRWAQGDREYVPQGKGFMGAAWDGFVPPPAVWDECFRVLKPGGHMAVFSGTRTFDLMALGIRLAGFTIRDSICWIAGSGFPKSHNVGKSTGDPKWDGFGTALKPAVEPIVLCRKPLSEKTVAANVLSWGTGAINVDATRIGLNGEPAPKGSGNDLGYHGGGSGTGGNTTPPQGRFPANVVLDTVTAGLLDQQSGVLHSQNPETRKSKSKRVGTTGFGTGESVEYADKGGASRFFHVAENLDRLDAPFKYCAKAPKKERPTVDPDPVLRLRDDLTPEQVDHVRARLQEAGVSLA